MKEAIGPNLYSYGNNEPTTNIDPLGLSPDLTSSGAFWDAFEQSLGDYFSTNQQLVDQIQGLAQQMSSRNPSINAASKTLASDLSKFKCDKSQLPFIPKDMREDYINELLNEDEDNILEDQSLLNQLGDENAADLETMLNDEGTLQTRGAPTVSYDTR